MTCSDAVDASGNGLASRERNSSSEAVVAIGRESTASRYLFACAAVISSKAFTLMFPYPLFVRAAYLGKLRVTSPSPTTLDGVYALRRRVPAQCCYGSRY
jgi:hypothetical protein